MAGSFASSAAAAGPGAATPSDVAGPIPASPAERRREIDAKLERFRAWLAERGHRGAALSARRNFAWLTAGGDNHVVAASEEGFATLLVTPAGLTVLTTVIEAARLRDEELNGLDVEVVGLPWHEPAALDAEIRARAGGPVPRDADLEPELAWLRAELLPEEVERLRRLGGATARAMTDTFTHARPGETELAVAARLAGRLADEAIAAPVLLAGADERIARYRHPIPTRRAIEAALMLVVVAEQGGLHVAMTRMGWLGGRPDPETERRYRAAARVDAELRAASRPGRRLADVLRAGIEAYAREGFPDEWRLHHQGGIIGYQPREVVATPATEGRIAVRMALAWNPSITGAKVEETVVVGADGVEVVTVDPRWPAGEGGVPAIRVVAEAGAG